MRKLILAFIATALAAVLAGGVAPAVAAEGDEPKPLKVKVVTFDGKQRLQVKRKLRLVTSCSKDCNATIKLRLVTPVTTTRASASTGIPATGTWTVNLGLSRFLRSYIRQNITRSKLVVGFRAVDIETGKTTSKVKTFRFRR